MMVAPWDAMWAGVRAAPSVELMVWMLAGALVASKGVLKADR